jgi:integrase
MKEATLASLDIQTHIKKERSDLYLLKIPGQETANGRALEYTIQGSTLKILKLYLKIYRPLLAPTTNTKLFISRTARHKQAYELASQIPKFIEKHTGLKMNIGLFRHFVAFLHLHKSKDDIETVRRLLSHVFSETTYTLYNSFIKQQSYEALDRIIKLGNAENKNA